MKKEGNYAFIDGQNLYMGTTKAQESWKIDLYKFRKYLERKYSVTKAFYFLGVLEEDRNDLYSKIQDAGFIVVFRQHTSQMISIKKGNVDTDLVFNVMRRLYKKEDFDKIVLVAGDGDYKNLVDFLIEEDRFKKILFPYRKNASSLYKKIDVGFKAFLDAEGTKKKITI